MPQYNNSSKCCICLNKLKGASLAKDNGSKLKRCLLEKVE